MQVAAQSNLSAIADGRLLCLALLKVGRCTLSPSIYFACPGGRRQRETEGRDDRDRSFSHMVPQTTGIAFCRRRPETAEREPLGRRMACQSLTRVRCGLAIRHCGAGW